MTLVREQESAEAIVPGATSRKTKPDGLTTREGLNLAGRHDHRGSCSGSDEADWPSYRQRPSWPEKECCVIPQGLPGTAVRGPACTVVWEAGGATLPPTRLSSNVVLSSFVHNS